MLCHPVVVVRTQSAAGGARRGERRGAPLRCNCMLCHPVVIVRAQSAAGGSRLGEQGGASPLHAHRCVRDLMSVPMITSLNKCRPRFAHPADGELAYEPGSKAL